jgi:hypothetical protein
VSQNVLKASAQIEQYPKIIQDLRDEVLKLKLDLNQDGDSNMNVQIKKNVEEMKIIMEKLLEKKANLDFYEQQLLLNETLIVQINSILLSISNTIELDHRKKLNNSMLVLNQALDNIHNANVTLTHNREEAARSIAKYNLQVQNLKLLDLQSGDKTRFESIYMKLQLDLDMTFFHRQQELFLKTREILNTNSNELFMINLQTFQANIGNTGSDLSKVVKEFVDTFVVKFSPNAEHTIDVTYETCTEDNLSDKTFTAKISKMFVDSGPIAPIPFNTPRKMKKPIFDSEEDLEDTPKQKKMKMTPGVLLSTKKFTPRKIRTPRKKARMSMIPKPMRTMPKSILRSFERLDE